MKKNILFLTILILNIKVYGSKNKIYPNNNIFKLFSNILFKKKIFSPNNNNKIITTQNNIQKNHKSPKNSENKNIFISTDITTIKPRK